MEAKASPFGKPPKPFTASPGVTGGKRINLEMNSVGSHTIAHFVKKVPDHQKEAVAKIEPFNILNAERVD